MTVPLCTRLVRVCALAVFCLAAIAVSAQVEHRATFEVGGGFTPPVGQLSNRLNAGWNAGAGAGVNLTKFFSLDGKFMYNGFGVNNGVLAAAGVPSGDAHIWSVTAEPRLQFGFAHAFSPYAVGGVGYYRRVVNFTQPTLTTATFFDPFFGVIFPGVVPATQVLRTDSRGGIGGSLGLGLSFALGRAGARFFTEARYHYADVGSRVPVRMVPVTFGIRF